MYKLGRLPSFDVRSRNFPVKSILTADQQTPRSFHWRCRTQLDQGSLGSCVGNAWAHELAARPAEVLGVTESTALDIYHKAQTLDEWPGENYEGTSVLAGIKALLTLYPHAVDEYRWTFGIDDVILTLGYRGPVVLGINWYESMFLPDGAGILDVNGDVAGGHAILATGINIKTGYIQLKNSWGVNWGMEGYGYISIGNLQRLLGEGGEGCVAVGRHNFAAV